MPQQFDIVENLNPRSRSQYPYLLVLQHDRLSFLRSVVVAPLVEWTNAIAASRIHPTLAVNEKRYVALIEDLATVQPSLLGVAVESAENRRYEIVAALDLLFTGV